MFPVITGETGGAGEIYSKCPSCEGVRCERGNRSGKLSSYHFLLSTLCMDSLDVAETRSQQS